MLWFWIAAVVAIGAFLLPNDEKYPFKERTLDFILVAIIGGLGAAFVNVVIAVAWWGQDIETHAIDPVTFSVVNDEGTYSFTRHDGAKWVLDADKVTVKGGEYNTFRIASTSDDDSNLWTVFPTVDAPTEYTLTVVPGGTMVYSTP